MILNISLGISVHQVMARNIESETEDLLENRQKTNKINDLFLLFQLLNYIHTPITQSSFEAMLLFSRYSSIGG